MTTRRAGTVWVAALCGLALGLGLAHVTDPARIGQARRAAGPDPATAADETAELQARREQVVREIELGNHLAARLAAGTLSLADAVGRMEPHLKARPGFDDACRHYYRVPNARLGTARHLIEKVEVMLEADPDRWAAVSERLEAEYASLECAAGDGR